MEITGTRGGICSTKRRSIRIQFMVHAMPFATEQAGGNSLVFLTPKAGIPQADDEGSGPLRFKTYSTRVQARATLFISGENGTRPVGMFSRHDREFFFLALNLVREEKTRYRDFKKKIPLAIRICE